MHDAYRAVTAIVELIVMRWCQDQRLHALCSHDQRVADDTLKIAQAGRPCVLCLVQQAISCHSDQPCIQFRVALRV
jgi:hypothetical protein